MNKSTILNVNESGLLRDITTYQSGVVQAIAYRALRKHVDFFLKDYGLTAMQWFIIGTIKDSGPAGMRISDVAVTIDTTIGFVTNTVNQLEAQGAVVRRDNQDDNRSKLVAVSEAYLATCNEIEIHLRRSMRQLLYARITPDELRIYIKVLYQLARLP